MLAIKIWRNYPASNSISSFEDNMVDVVLIENFGSWNPWDTCSNNDNFMDMKGLSVKGSAKECDK